jgi:hypothetical protein
MPASFTRIQLDKYSSFHDAELDVIHSKSLIEPWLSLGCDKLYDTSTCQLSLDIQANQYVPLEKRRSINEACIARAQEIPLLRLCLLRVARRAAASGKSGTSPERLEVRNGRRRQSSQISQT